MPPPKICPVCGHDSIKPVRRTDLLHIEGESPITDVLAYQCRRGHLFVVARDGPKATPKSPR